MARVVPSQIVGLNDQLFPSISHDDRYRKEWLGVNLDQTFKLQGILDLFDSVPSELLVLDSNGLNRLTCSIAAIRLSLLHPENIGPGLRCRLAPIGEFDGLNPIAIVRDLLAHCPDEFPSSDTNALTFIDGDEIRDNLRNDISAINRALSNSEWKAATVLGGSVIEALLLWKLQKQKPSELASVGKTLKQLGILSRDPSKIDLEKWHLSEYLEVARELAIISEEGLIMARQTKDFRNLIHPGKSARMRQKCNRSTALVAVAALEILVSQFSESNPPTQR